MGLPLQADDPEKGGDGPQHRRYQAGYQLKYLGQTGKRRYNVLNGGQYQRASGIQCQRRYVGHHLQHGRQNRQHRCHCCPQLTNQVEDWLQSLPQAPQHAHEGALECIEGPQDCLQHAGQAALQGLAAAGAD